MVDLTRRVGLGLGVCLLLAAGALGACGDDDDGGGGVQAYCDLSAELQDVGDPSDEQLDEIVEVAPEEIRDDAETLAEAIRSDDESAFQDEDVLDAVNAVTEFDEENCGGGDSTDTT